MATDLLQLVERFAGRPILLVGDLMLDRYLFGDAERISPEAPVPVLRVVDQQDRVGGAGSVALNIAALEAEVRLLGILGADDHGATVRMLLADAGIGTDHVLTVADRPTITKTRLVGLAEHRHRQQILRVDRERVLPPAAADEAQLLAAARSQLPQVAVVCLEDYAKGLLSASFCRELIAAARAAGTPVLVDPARSGDWRRYQGATLATPNRAELELGVGRSLTDDEIIPAAQELIARVDFQALLVTLGRDGALLVQNDGRVQRFPTRPRAVYDNTGAGDAVLAMTAVALAAGARFEQAVPLANIAGGLEVSKFGCVPITRQEVVDELHHGSAHGRGKLRTLTDLLPELDARRQRGETIVFTNGCFDILHPGHVSLLEQSKALGSILVVGLNSDESVRGQGKGDDRPIRRVADRARMLGALEAVDYIVTFDEPDPGRLIERVGPDILVKGADWAGKGVVGQESVEKRGGRVALIELEEGYSTTSELEKIRSVVSHQ
jgi:D-beta-D-heptose 7-phosphate kinase/D-beta-D-heptose 1-phosphate adenosyltransferase